MSQHSDIHADLAREYLARTRKQLQAAKHHRIYWIQLARQYGLTWKEIGDLLGEDQAAVRMAATRHTKQVA